MAAISSLFRRLGFVRLDEYGLILTPDDRLLSTRPAVLDDGLGGKIVGWKEGDLAAMELSRWEPMLPATGRATAKPPAIPAPPPIPRAVEAATPVARPRPPTVPVPVATVVAAPPPVAIFAPVPAHAPVAARPAPVIVAPPAPVVAAKAAACEDEDEWEWEIAVARARAAAEWAEEAAAAIAKPVAPVARPKRITAPIAVVAAPKPDPLKPDPLKTDEWPKTEELESWEKATPAPSKVEHVVRLMPRPALQTGTNPVITSAMPRPVPAAPKAPVLAAGSAPTRTTVIPVPALPRVSDPSMVRPVMSPRLPSLTPPPKRYPRATGRVDDTIRTHAAAAANDDKTSPNIALPPTRVASNRR
jgi:hypothetical protein